VAYEKACTQEGGVVQYDPGTHTLVCPAHGAVFDPANGGAVLQGPAVIALSQVMVRIHNDGTITAG
jgi:thiosulfate dehydrogenase [quinone] large subunit